MKNRIRECRLSLGMSRVELGKEVGLNENFIEGYEIGIIEPQLAMWEQFASALHVSPAYLVGWSDEKGQ
ncbi:helix-turn-helix domain-containing protein [Limosilactobacillus antri]|uniref:helix-turn-helix domain-containing protein n=1 Tax=Limosilactobacillus antri TaxID=227943 RepID=UPI001F57CEB5|nr:helix-turn-helix transcriptional regulator [Limosilactobacillus antri]